MADRLVVFAFGAHHAALIPLALVAILVRGGGSSALAEIGTLRGALLGLWLAALSWGATAWTLRARTLASANVRELVARAAAGGLAAGALFLPGAFAILTIAQGFELVSLFIFVFAAPFAGAAGSIVGTALALVDVALLKIARAVAKVSYRR